MRRLAAIQRGGGRVTLADIKAIFPVETMSPEQLGQAMAQLEAAGIEIEFDKALLRRHSDPRNIEIPTIHGTRTAVDRAARPSTGCPTDAPPLAQPDRPVRSNSSWLGPWSRSHVWQISILVACAAALVLIVVMRS